MSTRAGPSIVTNNLNIFLDAANAPSLPNANIRNLNLLLSPEDFDSGNWAKNASVNVSANAGLAPDGSMTADKMVGTVGSAGRKGVFGYATLSAGVTYTFSVYLKAAGYTSATMWFDNFYTSPGAYIGASGLLDLTTGVSSNTTHANMINVGNGWYRCYVGNVQTQGGVHAVYITLGQANGTGTPVGNGVDGILMWGAQLERSGEPFSNPTLEMNFSPDATLPGTVTFTRSSTGTYISGSGLVTSAAVNAPRFDYDVVNGQWRGLLIEPAATNRYTASGDGIPAAFVSGNFAANFNLATTNTPASASNVTNGVRLFSVNTATSAQHYLVSDTVAWTTTTWNTYSVYLKANSGTIFPIITLEDGSGNGVWARIDLTTPANSTSGVNGAGVLGTSGAEVLANNWRRCWVSGRGFAGARFGITSSNVNGGSGWYPSYAGTVGDSFYVWGIQLESNFSTSKPTSFIYSGTRAVDNAVMTGTNFTNWFNQSEGTMLVEFYKTKETNYSYYNHPYNISDGTGNNQYYLFGVETASYITYGIVTGGVGQSDVYQAVTAATGLNRYVMSYKTNQAAYAINSTLRYTDSTVALPAVNRMKLGGDSGNNANLNDCISRIIYWPYAVEPARLANLSGGQNTWYLGASTSTSAILPSAYYSTATVAPATITWDNLSTSTSNSTNKNLAQVEVLVVAGGGGGGGDIGGGGGGGGVIYNPAFAVASGTSYTVTVGAGGVGLPFSGIGQVQGPNGSNSVFGSLTAIGGGGGAVYHQFGSNGGSGGGGSAEGGSGLGTAGQGFNGGIGGGNVQYNAGGGGGAGGAGQAGEGVNFLGGDGGVGVTYDISGVPTGYGGGGGGGGNSRGGNATQGGGAGLPRFAGDVRGLNGTPNTGGGGGGTGGFGGTSSGGSGIVIVRYPLPLRATGGTITVVNNQVIHTFTSGTNTFVVDNSEIQAINGPTYVTSTAGNYLLFDGVNDYMTLTPQNLQRNFTLEIWAYITQNSTALFGHGLPGSPGLGLHILWNYYNNRGMVFGMWANDLDTPSYNLVFNQWHQFVFTYNNTTYFREFYADGVLVNSGTRTVYTGTGQLLVGTPYGTPGYGSLVRGRVSNVKMYTSVLTAAEIRQNFHALRGRYGI
jgi:hypothetical protein